MESISQDSVIQIKSYVDEYVASIPIAHSVHLKEN
jgi:hypothetical protein